MAGQNGDGKDADAAAHAAWNDAVAIQVDTAAEITRQLRLTLDRLDALMAAQPTDWQQWHFPQLRREVGQMLEEFGVQAGDVVVAGAEASWNQGIAVVDQPLATVGVTLEGIVPQLDRGQLMAMQSFLTHKMRGIAAAGANRINTELGLVVTGLNAPAQATTAIEAIAAGGRRRALTVVRTELGRAFSTATQGRLTQAVGAGLKGLKKQWRRSGKIHSRRTHDLADGQIKDVDEPFMVGGEKLMYPRDPAASAANTVNCGCTQLPYMVHWEMLHPGDKPYSTEETGASQTKRDIQQVRADGFRQWAGDVLSGQRQPQGDWQTVGTLSADAVAELHKQGIKPATMEIAISDKMLRRPRRAKKRDEWKKDIPDDLLTHMPDIFDRPKAVFFGAKDRSLHYVFDIPGEQRLGKLVVRVRANDSRSRNRHHNYVVSGGKIDRDQLLVRSDYVPITGVV